MPGGLGVKVVDPSVVVGGVVGLEMPMVGMSVGIRRLGGQTVSVPNVRPVGGRAGAPRAAVAKLFAKKRDMMTMATPINRPSAPQHRGRIYSNNGETSAEIKRLRCLFHNPNSDS